MSNYYEIISKLDNDLCPDKNFDIVKRELIIGGRNAVMYFIDGLIKDEVYEKVFEFLFKQKSEDMNGVNDMRDFAKNKMPYIEVSVSYDVEEIKTAVLSGPAAFVIDGIHGFLIVDTRTYPMRGIEEPQKDKSLRGSRDGFVEALVTNTALIRRRIRDENLRMEHMQIGTRTKLDVVISYIDGLVDKKMLKTLREKLKCIEIEGISMTQQAISEKLQKSSFFNPYPKFKFTERPDYASACILDGRIALVMDNSPTVMLFPISMSDFLRETDDYCFLPLSASYIRTVRIIVALSDVLLTPVYLLFVNNPQYIPDCMSFIKPTVETAVPIAVQFLVLEFIVDGLRLASVNTPETLSNSLSIIGGLLLSEFAINAGWFVTEAVLLTAFVTIASFSLPSFEMTYAMKFERIFILISVQLFNLRGLIGGIIIITAAKLLTKTINGRNYFYPIIPFDKKAFCELFLRFPLK